MREFQNSLFLYMWFCVVLCRRNFSAVLCCSAEVHFIKVAFDVFAHVNFSSVLIYMRRNPYKDSILKHNSEFSGLDCLSLFGWGISRLIG